MSGYDLAKLAGDSVVFYWPAGHSQIYSELKKLNDGGLIVGEEIPQSGKPNKVVSTVTDAGRIDLSDWANDAHPDDRAPRPNRPRGEHVGASLALAGGIRFEEAWIGWMRDIIALCERSATVPTS